MNGRPDRTTGQVDVLEARDGATVVDGGKA